MEQHVFKIVIALRVRHWKGVAIYYASKVNIYATKLKCIFKCKQLLSLQFFFQIIDLYTFSQLPSISLLLYYIKVCCILKDGT